MTDRAFQKLVDALVDCDYDLDEEPDFRVNPAMLTFVTDLFKKKIFLHDYEKTFSTETETQTQGLDRMNEALQQLIPFVNEGGNPDFNRIARETGTSAEELRELFLELKKKVGR